MKNILLVLLCCLSFMCTKAQAPQGIPYQSIIRNVSGSLLFNQSVQVRVTIHDSGALGNIVYQETHATTTSAAAMVIITIGQGSVVTGDFSTINWGSAAKFMQVELDATGGNNYVDLGTQQMMSVPYALYSQSSGDVKIKHYIGEFYGGGVVIDVWRDTSGSEHGTIMALNNIGNVGVNSSYTYIWGPSVLTYDEYNGAINCNLALQNNPDPNSAIALCQNYNAGGFTDWYLPARYEMLNADLIPVRRTLKLMGGATIYPGGFGPSGNSYNMYWTSTTQQYLSSYAYFCYIHLNMYPAGTGYYNAAAMIGIPLGCDRTIQKSAQIYVRPVRRF